MKISFLIILFSICSSLSNAQKGSLAGKLIDGTGKKMPLSTISIYNATDSSFITYRLSGNEGDFKVSGLPLNTKLRTVISFTGYETYRKEFMFTSSVQLIDLGLIKMQNSTKQLDEITVISERPPVIIKKDTIEFNANAFKTLPTALVEDLLKKLPGIMVNESGDILFNGQKVNRILIDGKRFFGDNVQMATRNLPSNYIDKVQVVDDKEQINNQFNEQNAGKLINLTLKKGVKKGWFGKLYGGLGTDERYEFGAIASKFRDTFQVSIIGYNNNVNRSSFSTKDVRQLGGFNRDTYKFSSSGDGYRLNGISFGGGNSGITTSSAVGINLNHAPSKTLSLYGQYFIGNTSTLAEIFNNTKYSLNDSLINRTQIKNELNKGFSHNINAGINWKPNKYNDISFRASYSNLNSNINSPTTLTTSNNKVGIINTSIGELITDIQSKTYEHTLFYNSTFPNHAQRTLDIMHTFSYDNNSDANITETVNFQIFPVNTFVLFNQKRNSLQPSTNTNTYFRFGDILTKNIRYDLFSEVNYANKTQDIYTFNKSSNSNEYDSINVALSNGLKREQLIWRNRFSLQHKFKNYRLYYGITFKQQWVNDVFSIKPNTSIKQQLFNPLFNARVSWKNNIISFSQDLIVPDIAYLIPVPDNTNPFFIFKGNSSLAPTKSHSFSIENNLYNTKKQTNFFYLLNITFYKNYIINSIEINEKGVQTNMPINVNKSFFSNFSTRFSKQFIKGKQFSSKGSLVINGAYNIIPVLFNNVSGNEDRLNGSLNIGVNFNWNDVIEFSPSYSPSFRKSYYSNNLFSTRNVQTQKINAEMVIRAPQKMVWETNLFYSKLNDASNLFPAEQVYWNAAISYLFLKEDKGQIKLAIYDILNKNNNVTSTINGNAVIENRTNVLGRYLMLTFNYDLRSLVGADKKPKLEKETIFKF